MLRAARDPVASELQRFVEEGASDSDDTGDLPTAWLLLFERSGPTVEPAAGDARQWAAAAGVGQGGSPPGRDGPALTDPTMRALFESLPATHRGYLSPALRRARWSRLDRDEAARRLVRLCCRGVANEPPICYGDPGAAGAFVTRLMGWLGEPCETLASGINRGGGVVFEVGHCLDEGVVLLAPRRVGLLWFLGYD